MHPWDLSYKTYEIKNQWTKTPQLITLLQPSGYDSIRLGSCSLRENEIGKKVMSALLAKVIQWRPTTMNLLWMD